MIKQSLYALGACALVSSAQAAVTYSVFQDGTDTINEDSIINFAGQTTSGVNFGAGGDLTVTSNGNDVVFTSNTTFLDQNQIDFGAPFNVENNYQGAFTDADFNTLLDNGRFANASGPDELIVGGLAGNTTYQIQFFYTDARDAATLGREIDIAAGSAGSSDIITLTSNATGGQYGIFQFTTGAGDTSASFFVDANGTDTTSHLNAYAISAVPEPSSTALLGLGGLALIMRRRK